MSGFDLEEDGPRPMDRESLRDLLDAYGACLETLQTMGLGPGILIDLCRLMLLASAGFRESMGETMPPSKAAVREELGRLAGLLRANQDM